MTIGKKAPASARTPQRIGRRFDKAMIAQLIGFLMPVALAAFGKDDIGLCLRALHKLLRCISERKSMT